ncbi:hypothetical protein Hdeb2414_s0020g00562941 [Helianthus debilis subsp. tardiflorus]
MTRVRLFGSSQVIPSEKTASLPNPQLSLPFRFYEKFVKGVVARIMFVLSACSALHPLLAAMEPMFTQSCLVQV